ncbi:hypothetical protein Bca101_023938 [Brassica carinata]
MGVWCPVLGTRDGLLLNLPCLSDPVRRSSLFLKLALVALHLFFIGFLLVFDAEFIDKTNLHPWYMSSYFFLFSVTLLQYFLTSGSSPGYVIDAMRDVDETNAMYRNAPTTSSLSGFYFTFVRHNSTSDGTEFYLAFVCHTVVLILFLVSQKDSNFLAEDGYGLVPSANILEVMFQSRMVSFGQCRLCSCSTCFYRIHSSVSSLRISQPPRAKHCHDCDRCVLQFDHHCVWLGTCVGQKNHCKFWWYICEESALCIWTLIKYIDYLTNVTKPWWKNAIIILLLVILVISLIFVLLLLLFHSYLILTNQSTYELVRRKRIPYMRNFPERVHPFSRGIKRNLYNVCCGNDTLDSLPTAYELEDRSRSSSYTCLDILKCRCC